MSELNISQKEEKDIINPNINNNNISSIQIYKTEGGRISGESKEDHEYSDDDFSSKSNFYRRYK